jgi:hypothetical protein
MIRERWRELMVPAALFATALLLAVPAALGPVRLNDSFWIDLVWLDQFARELGHGVLYPRWLPLSHDGLGSPVFYYYPPLAFYLAAAFAVVGAGTYLALVATFAAANLISGAGAYLWFKDQSERPLAGALLFMIAPYHLFNFYLRGAIAEFVATATLPFVLWGIRQIILGRPRASGWTALAYAALMMSHLPLALLASLFLFAPYALANTGRSPALLARIGGALALGVAVSAIYLVPALALEPYRSASDLWSQTYLQPATWSIWSTHAWSNQTFRAVLLISAALAIPAVALLLLHRSAWAVCAVLCLVIGIGAVPLIWSLPVLRMVQFPFRLLPIAEVALVTGVMLAPKDRVPWLMLWVTFLLAAAFIVGATPESAPSGDRVLRQFHPDVPENLPPGQRPYSWPSKWALQLAKEHRQPQFDGTTTVEPVFYFPAWQVRCGGRAVPSSPDPQTQLLTYRGRGCSRSMIMTAPEKIGAAISLLALVALLSLLFSPSLLERRRSLRRESPLRNT